MESALDPTSYSLDDQDKSLFLHDYAIYHGYPYLYSRAARKDTDRDKAIEVAQEAVDGILFCNPHRNNALCTLGFWLGIRARDTKQKEHNDQAIKVHRQALENTPPAGAGQFNVLRGLTSHLQLRNELEGSKDDLQEALGFACHAIHRIPEYHTFCPQCLGLREEIRELAESENLQHGDCDVGYIKIQPVVCNLLYLSSVHFFRIPEVTIFNDSRTSEAIFTY
jgi:tetratricopeptide (TPR) repeat protein